VTLGRCGWRGATPIAILAKQAAGGSMFYLAEPALFDLFAALLIGGAPVLPKRRPRLLTVRSRRGTAVVEALG
jgi:hypothetical protein